VDSMRKPRRIWLKMVSMERLESSGCQIMLKWRKSLGVTLLRPPPGGAHDETKRQSLTVIKKCFLRS